MNKRKVIADLNSRMKRRVINRADNQTHWAQHASPLQQAGRRKILNFLRAAWLETTQVQITYLPIRIAKLPLAFQHFKIVQLSDVHHSSFVSESEIITAAQRANELQPDLIVLTGDYVSHSPDFIPGCARALGHLK